MRVPQAVVSSRAGARLSLETGSEWAGMTGWVGLVGKWLCGWIWGRMGTGVDRVKW